MSLFQQLERVRTPRRTARRPPRAWPRRPSARRRGGPAPPVRPPRHLAPRRACARNWWPRAATVLTGVRTHCVIARKGASAP
ncbi:hypothetical protein LV779_19950 [Streptomyces thinghirensis]|nr:hypothetical protein [Streptomyces thinghirensis]